jgi:formylglycine-generating enzyme required for sulfatase activity
MASFDATRDQPIGMDESDVKTFLEKELRSDLPRDLRRSWPKVWSEVFLLMTPSWRAEVPAFRISKYEVSNAQWERFLKDRTDQVETRGDETLEQVAIDVWRIGEPDAAQREVSCGWRILLAWNSDVLLPVLNPKKDTTWDPMAARAAQAKLPKGLRLSLPRYLPDTTWTDGRLPDALRRRPATNLSWEQAADFCAWAGFHLPTEIEWERAARGTEGRRFSWGNTWEPLRCGWERYNAAAIKAGKPETPPVTVPGAQGEAQTTTPCAADVDAFPQGATPEGVLNLTGNVSEYTAWRAWKYAGSNSTFAFVDGSTAVVRGGNYLHRAELLLAADRNCEGPQGALLPSHSVGGYGFRVAAYPVPGADLTLPLALRWNDERDTEAPFWWLPTPAGCPDRRNSAQYLGFDPQLTAGLLERQVRNDAPDFVFVTGPATGLAFLPIRGVAFEHVKDPAELAKLARDPDRMVVLGVLTGTERAGFRVLVPGSDLQGTAAVRPTDVAFTDERFAFAAEERRLTREFLGAVLVLDGDRVAVYAPNPSLRKAARHREGLVGYLESNLQIASATPGETAPTVATEKDVAVLATTLRYLDRAGRPTLNGTSPGIRVTLRVPFVRDLRRR